MAAMKIVRINDPESLNHISRCEVYQAISDYEICSRIFLKDPSDREAYNMMKECEEFILTDPRVDRCIKDPVLFLDEIDGIVEKEYKRWVKKCNK